MEKDNYKEIIRRNIGNTLGSGFIPELGRHKQGKVRDVHFTALEVGRPIVMVASDRISCFDHVLEQRIPFKGAVLTLLNRWAFENSKDIVPNAMVQSPHPNVVVQRYYRNIMIECVVRGYVWGSLAGEYEAGKRLFCGLRMPDGLLRYERLKEPLFTPTTKSEHDEAMTFGDVEQMLGAALARKVKETSIRLYERGAQLAQKAGLIFIDTKYEFGLDDEGGLYLIDEANTPDSSRYCDAKEYEKFALIQKELRVGCYKDVSELLKRRPELKIKELSKQFARDVLVEKGFSYGSSGAAPSLDADDVVEVSLRYVNLYERLTGEKFPFTDANVRLDLVDKLAKSGLIKGAVAVIMAGSDSDLPHVERIKQELDAYGIRSVVRICSAHKQPSLCESIVKEYNSSLEPVVVIAVAGGTDALSGVASFHSVHPVISCPPKSDEYSSCLANPPGSSNSLVLRPANVARHVAQLFGGYDETLRRLLVRKNEEKVAKLVKADEALQGVD